MALNTAITRMLGIRHPIIQGGMHYVGFAPLAAAGARHVPLAALRRTRPAEATHPTHLHPTPPTSAHRTSLAPPHTPDPATTWSDRPTRAASFANPEPGFVCV